LKHAATAATREGAPLGAAMTRDLFQQLKFRDPIRARALADALRRNVDAIGREVSVMHVCGSHEQAIARFGLRAVLPPGLQLIMGPGCPVCVTDGPEVDEAVALAGQGARVCTYGDMLRLPGTARSLADAQADGGRVEVVYSVAQAVELAGKHPGEEVVFFASGFETTAVATAAVALTRPPPNFSILSVHKYVPAAMEIVAASKETNIEGYVAAGHAAIITGWAIFEPFAARTRAPVVVAGFEPLDILAALVKLTELMRDGQPEVANVYPRCVSREGNLAAQRSLWKVFRTVTGQWRGIAEVPGGNLDLTPDFAHLDARRRFRIDTSGVRDDGAAAEAKGCICGAIMLGLATPTDCALFKKACAPESPVGACMVSSEGQCRIWHTYGGTPDLRQVG
jgi:hydrogenase expression/formation protein HypD